MFRILLLIALLITMMSGCGGDETKPPDPPPDADESLIGSWERFGSAHVKFGFDENIEIDVTKDTLVFASDSHPTDDDDHELVGTWTQNISIKYTDDFSHLGNGHVGVNPPGEAIDPPGGAVDNIVASNQETLSISATFKGQYTTEGNRITLSFDEGKVTLDPAELWKKYVAITEEDFLERMRDAYPITGTWSISDGKLTLTDDEGEKTLFNRKKP